MKLTNSLVAALCLATLDLVFLISPFAIRAQQGVLEATDKDGKSLGACPLKHTNVKAEISGFLTRVRVRQEFENNFSEKIEAVYTFPLSNAAAVDEMTMTIGTRLVKGKILRREEAQNLYQTARDNGQAAALLDQERPNIFTQSVANILPGEQVMIEISYVETLKYEAGTYEFVFPTVVAPRYNPSQVADAGKISPPVAPAATRAGHDISIEVVLDAGVPVESIISKSHQIETNQLSASRAVIRLKDSDKIPNKDFILRYDVAGKKINDAVLTHRDETGGFFTLILQPPDNPPAQDVTPKEIVFVLDTSGSMNGFPIETAKKTMKLALDGLYPNDTFNLITFAGDTHVLFDRPVPATKENLKKAQDFLRDRSGSGGTEMMTAIRAALKPSDAANHIRIVCFMTDGEVGNDAEIIAEVQKHQNARVFSFGIGSSINRNLLDKIAEEGRGEAEYVGLDDDGSAAAKRFHERVRAPLLTGVEIDWNGLPVADVYPTRIQDLFSAKPVVIHGRYTGAATGTIRLKGKSAGQTVVREIPVVLPETEAAHDALATLWARSRIDDLTKQDYTNQKPEIKEAITNLGLEFRLLTAFTSFVAVEELITTDGGQLHRIDVPVELPEGMNRETTIGTQGEITQNQIVNLPINGRSAASFSMLSSETVNVVSVDQTESRVSRRARPKTIKKDGKIKSKNRSSGGSGSGTGVARGSGNGRGNGNSSESGYAKGEAVIATINNSKGETLSLEDQKLLELKTKLAPTILALLERLKDVKAQPAPDEIKFVKNGKAEIRVYLADKTPAAIEELKMAGLELMLDPTTAKFVIGRIAVEKLAALAELKSVKFIAPQF